MLNINHHSLFRSMPFHSIAVHSIAVLFVLSSLELKGRPLYLTGESYAGVYVPTLAKALLESQTVGTKRVR
jgi:carboxypeptidase C (cathepsin A)